MFHIYCHQVKKSKDGCGVSYSREYCDPFSVWYNHKDVCVKNIWTWAVQYMAESQKMIQHIILRILILSIDLVTAFLVRKTWTDRRSRIVDTLSIMKEIIDENC